MKEFKQGTETGYLDARGYPIRIGAKVKYQSKNATVSVYGTLRGQGINKTLDSVRKEDIVVVSDEFGEAETEPVAQAAEQKTDVQTKNENRKEVIDDMVIEEITDLLPKLTAQQRDQLVDALLTIRSINTLEMVNCRGVIVKEFRFGQEG